MDIDTDRMSYIYLRVLAHITRVASNVQSPTIEPTVVREIIDRNVRTYKF